jgi:hypothetical protein
MLLLLLLLLLARTGLGGDTMPIRMASWGGHLDAQK